MSGSSGSSVNLQCHGTVSEDSSTLHSQSGGYDTTCSETSFDTVASHKSRETLAVRFNPEVCQHPPANYGQCDKPSKSKSGKKRHKSSNKKKSSASCKLSDAEIVRPLCGQVLDNARVATPSVSRRGSTRTCRTHSEGSLSSCDRRRGTCREHRAVCPKHQPSHVYPTPQPHPHPSHPPVQQPSLGYATRGAYPPQAGQYPPDSFQEHFKLTDTCSVPPKHGSYPPPLGTVTKFSSNKPSCNPPLENSYGPSRTEILHKTSPALCNTSNIPPSKNSSRPGDQSRRGMSLLHEDTCNKPLTDGHSAQREFRPPRNNPSSRPTPKDLCVFPRKRSPGDDPCSSSSPEAYSDAQEEILRHCDDPCIELPPSESDDPKPAPDDYCDAVEEISPSEVPNPYFGDQRNKRYTASPTTQAPRNYSRYSKPQQNDPCHAIETKEVPALPRNDTCIKSLPIDPSTDSEDKPASCPVCEDPSYNPPPSSSDNHLQCKQRTSPLCEDPLNNSLKYDSSDGPQWKQEIAPQCDDHSKRFLNNKPAQNDSCEHAQWKQESYPMCKDPCSNAAKDDCRETPECKQDKCSPHCYQSNNSSHAPCDSPHSPPPRKVPSCPSITNSIHGHTSSFSIRAVTDAQPCDRPQDLRSKGVSPPRVFSGEFSLEAPQNEHGVTCPTDQQPSFKPAKPDDAIRTDQQTPTDPSSATTGQILKQQSCFSLSDPYYALSPTGLSRVSIKERRSSPVLDPSYYFHRCTISQASRVRQVKSNGSCMPRPVEPKSSPAPQSFSCPPKSSPTNQPPGDMSPQKCLEPAICTEQQSTAQPDRPCTPLTDPQEKAKSLSLRSKDLSLSPASKEDAPYRNLSQSNGACALENIKEGSAPSFDQSPLRDGVSQVSPQYFVKPPSLDLACDMATQTTNDSTATEGVNTLSRQPVEGTSPSHGSSQPKQEPSFYGDPYYRPTETEAFSRNSPSQAPYPTFEGLCGNVQHGAPYKTQEPTYDASVNYPSPATSYCTLSPGRDSSFAVTPRNNFSTKQDMSAPDVLYSTTQQPSSPQHCPECLNTPNRSDNAPYCTSPEALRATDTDSYRCRNCGATSPTFQQRMPAPDSSSVVSNYGTTPYHANQGMPAPDSSSASSNYGTTPYHASQGMCAPAYSSLPQQSNFSANVTPAKQAGVSTPTWYFGPSTVQSNFKPSVPSFKQEVDASKNPCPSSQPNNYLPSSQHSCSSMAWVRPEDSCSIHQTPQPCSSPAEPPPVVYPASQSNYNSNMLSSEQQNHNVDSSYSMTQTVTCPHNIHSAKQGICVHKCNNSLSAFVGRGLPVSDIPVYYATSGENQPLKHFRPQGCIVLTQSMPKDDMADSENESDKPVADCESSQMRLTPEPPTHGRACQPSPSFDQYPLYSWTPTDENHFRIVGQISCASLSSHCQCCAACNTDLTGFCQIRCTSPSHHTPACISPLHHSVVNYPVPVYNNGHCSSCSLNQTQRALSEGPCRSISTRVHSHQPYTRGIKRPNYPRSRTPDKPKGHFSNKVPSRKRIHSQTLSCGPEESTQNLPARPIQDNREFVSSRVSLKHINDQSGLKTGYNFPLIDIHNSKPLKQEAKNSSIAPEGKSLLDENSKLRSGLISEVFPVPPSPCEKVEKTYKTNQPSIDIPLGRHHCTDEILQHPTVPRKQGEVCPPRISIDNVDLSCSQKGSPPPSTKRAVNESNEDKIDSKNCDSLIANTSAGNEQEKTYPMASGNSAKCTLPVTPRNCENKSQSIQKKLQPTMSKCHVSIDIQPTGECVYLGQSARICWQDSVKSVSQTQSRISQHESGNAELQSNPRKCSTSIQSANKQEQFYGYSPKHAKSKASSHSLIKPEKYDQSGTEKHVYAEKTPGKVLALNFSELATNLQLPFVVTPSQISKLPLAESLKAKNSSHTFSSVKITFGGSVHRMRSHPHEHTTQTAGSPVEHRFKETPCQCSTGSVENAINNNKVEACHIPSRKHSEETSQLCQCVLVQSSDEKILQPAYSSSKKSLRTDCHCTSEATTQKNKEPACVPPGAALLKHEEHQRHSIDTQNSSILLRTDVRESHFDDPMQLNNLILEEKARHPFDAVLQLSHRRYDVTLKDVSTQVIKDPRNRSKRQERNLPVSCLCPTGQPRTSEQPLVQDARMLKPLPERHQQPDQNVINLANQQLHEKPMNQDITCYLPNSTINCREQNDLLQPHAFEKSGLQTFERSWFERGRSGVTETTKQASETGQMTDSTSTGNKPEEIEEAVRNATSLRIPSRKVDPECLPDNQTDLAGREFSQTSVKKVIVQIVEPDTVEESKPAKKVLVRTLTPHPRSGRDLRYSVDGESRTDCLQQTEPDSAASTQENEHQQWPPLHMMHFKSEPEDHTIDVNMSNITAPLEMIRLGLCSSSCLWNRNQPRDNLQGRALQIVTPNTAHTTNRLVETALSKTVVKSPSAKTVESEKHDSEYVGIFPYHNNQYLSAFHAVIPSYKLNPLTDSKFAVHKDFNAPHTSFSEPPYPLNPVMSYPIECNAGSESRRRSSCPNIPACLSSFTNHNVNEKLYTNYKCTQTDCDCQKDIPFGQSSKMSDRDQSSCRSGSEVCSGSQTRSIEHRHHRQDRDTRPLRFSTPCPGRCGVFMLWSDLGSFLSTPSPCWDRLKNHRHHHHDFNHVCRPHPEYYEHSPRHTTYPSSFNEAVQVKSHFSSSFDGYPRGQTSDRKGWKPLEFRDSATSPPSTTQQSPKDSTENVTKNVRTKKVGRKGGK